MRYPVVMDALNDMAVIQTTFETLRLFPIDDPIRAEILEVVVDARNNLVRFFQSLHQTLETEPAPWDMFKRCTLKMMTEGCSGQLLNNLMKLKAFDAKEVFYYRVAGMENLETVRKMPAQQVALLLTSDLLQAVQNEDCFSEEDIFLRNVFQKYIAFLYAWFVMFYGMDVW